MPFQTMAPAVTGTIASSSEYNKVVDNVNQLNTTRTKYKNARASGSVHTVTTTITDLPGASVSFSTAEANTTVKITGIFDVESNGAADIFVGACSIDGAAAEAAEAHFQGIGRVSVVQSWIVTLTASGSHSAKLRVYKSSNSNTVVCYAIHSVISVEGQGVT